MLNLSKRFLTPALSARIFKNQVALQTVPSRWRAIYRVIPDERPLIEQTLKEMVTHIYNTAFQVHASASCVTALVSLQHLELLS